MVFYLLWQRQGYTTLVSYCIQAVIDYFFMNKIVKKKVYEMPIIIGLACIVVFVALTSNLLYGNDIIRYVILILVMTVILIKHKKILSFLVLNR